MFRVEATTMIKTPRKIGSDVYAGYAR